MKKRTTRSTRRAVSFAIIAVGMLLSVVGLTVNPAAAADVNPTSVYDIADGPGGNTTCAVALAGKPVPATTQFGGAGGFTDNGAKSDGTLSVTTSGFPGALSFQVTGVDPAVQVYAVLIKETNSTRIYYYEDGVGIGDGDSGLGGPNGGVSNYKLCYAVPAAPPTGDVTLQKLTTGAADPADGTAFSFTVVCESGTVPNSPVQILSNAAAVSVATGVTVGDDCTITETDAQGAASTVFSVDGAPQPAGNAVTVTVGNANGVAVIATNDFPAVAPRTGDVTLAKATTGGTAPAPGTAFTFTVDCESGTETSPVQVLSGAAAVTVATDVVLGDDCTITETGTQGAASTVYSVNGAVQPAGTAVTITVGSENGVAVVATNSYPTTPPPPPPPPGATTGSLSLDKVVTGEGAVDGTEFAFDIDCSNGLDTSVSLSDTDPAHVINNLPTGTTCEIVETDDGDAVDTTWSGGTALDGENGVSVTIGNGTTVSVTATNEFELEVLPLPPVVRPPVTPPVVTPPAPPAPPTQVAGVVIPRSLPRTGTDALPLVELGLGMILLGFGAMLFGRERTALI